MQSQATQTLTQLTESVLSSVKYRHVTPALVQLIGSQELSKRNNLKAAVKATKNKLHQLTGAYWHGKPNYDDWLALLQVAADTDDTPDGKLLHTTCRTLMAHHASTHERLPIIRNFYATLFAGLPPVHSVLDLACGLNPLSIPWMELPPNTTYYACDVNDEQMRFLQQALSYLDVCGKTFVCDLLQELPKQRVDIALLLKTIPCLEQIDHTIGPRLLAGLQAKVIFVSFPVQSLGGRNKGMVDSYSAHFAQILSEAGHSSWDIEQFFFATEMVFRLRKSL